jgi:hypothetical protein
MGRANIVIVVLAVAIVVFALWRQHRK